MSEINYNKLRLDILEDLICQRMIDCHNNRTDMIRQLKLDDEGKYVRKTTVEKHSDDTYMIGIDPASHEDLVKIGKLVEKHEAARSHYAWGRLYYISKINILENGLD
jgi:hypothetical protein